jgi:hypothetical protein
VATKNVSSDEWVELVPSNAEDDYSIVVEEQSIYLFVGDKPARPVAGLPLRNGAIYSLEADRFEGIYARAQGDVDASVRTVPNLRIDGSNERAVTVSTSVQTDTYDRGADFDRSTYPITLDPDETIQQVLLSIVLTEVDVEVTTTDGDVVTIPVDSKTVLDSYSAEKVVIKNPDDATARTAGGWAGE